MTNDPSEQKRRWRGERERGLRKASTCLIVRRFSAVGHSPRTHERTSFAYLPLPVCPRCSPEYLVPDIWYLFVPRGRYRGEISCGCNADRTMWIYIYIYMQGMAVDSASDCASPSSSWRVESGARSSAPPPLQGREGSPAAPLGYYYYSTEPAGKDPWQWETIQKGRRIGLASTLGSICQRPLGDASSG